MPRKAPFELSPDVDTLISYMRERQRVTYRELSTLVKREIAGRERYVLLSARRVLERDGIFFAVDRGVGLHRATNPQIATLSTTHAIEKIRRVSSKANRRQVHVNIQDLTAEQRESFDIGRSVLGAVRNSTSRALRNKLETEARKSDGGVIQINNVLALPRHRKA